MGTVEIIPRVIFSLRPFVKQNAHYITDFQILYAAGSVLVLHNYHETRQKHIKLFEKSVYLEMIAVSNNRKFAAIIQNSEKGQIIVFDLETLKKKRTLNLPHESNSNRFETFSFSYDDTYIMAITGEPDWNMIVYNWNKGKVSSMTRVLPYGSSNTVAQICCSPVSNSEFCVVGNGIFKLYGFYETVWRPYGFQKAEQINITSACWLNSEVILSGTSDGKLFIVENGDLKGVYDAINSFSIKLKGKEESFQQIASSSILAMKKVPVELEGQDLSVRALFSFSKGFAYSCKPGFVHLFEKDEYTYKKRNIFQVDDPVLGDETSVDINVVKHLSINVSQDRLLASTNKAQLYVVRLWGPDLHVAKVIPFKHLGEPLHNGEINGLCVCVWKPIFVTSGKYDQTLQIWNYNTETVQTIKRFEQKILSVDLHSSGNFLAIVFPEKVFICLILMNDIQPCRVLSVPKCKFCKYNFYGNYLAAVCSNKIEIFSTIVWNTSHTLEGHTDEIMAMIWGHEDKKIVSCGSDGSIMIWDIIKGELIGEVNTPGVCYLDIAMSSDGRNIYAVGNDGRLKEIIGSTIVKVIDFNQNNLNKVVLSRSNLMMFLAGQNSDLISVKMPLTDPPEYSFFQYHSSAVTTMKLSVDDLTLISVSEGGSVIIWKLSHAEGKTVPMDKNFSYYNEVMINRDELEEKIMLIKDLSQRLYELEMGQARKIRDTENRYCDKIKDLHENNAVIIEGLKNKIELMEKNQTKQLFQMKKEVDDLKKKQEMEKETMLKNYTSKLLVEYENVKKLDTQKEETVNNYEQILSDLIRVKEEQTNEIINFYKKKLEEVNTFLIESHQENYQNINEHEITKQYIEEDADRELFEARAKYEKIVKEEKELQVSLKSETILMRKKFAEALKEKTEFRVALEQLQSQQQKFQSNIQALEKDVADLKLEIVDRDAAIKAKDQRIYFLKQKIQESDKFKFVLDYKMKELKNQIDPKDREIKERKEEIVDMETELSNLKKINTSLELQSIELKEKIRGTEKEVAQYEKKNESAHITLRQIQVDIYLLYQGLEDFKKVKDGTMLLYHKYYKDEVPFVKEQYGDTDVQRDLILQREFLEKTILALKSTLKKSQQNKGDKYKVIKDNMVLLEELNLVRKDLKEALTVVKNLEHLIGIKDKKTVAPSDALNRLMLALKKQEDIKKKYEDVIEKATVGIGAMSEKAKNAEERLNILGQSPVSNQ